MAKSVAYINLGCYYIFGLPIGFLFGYLLCRGVEEQCLICLCEHMYHKGRVPELHYGEALDREGWNCSCASDAAAQPYSNVHDALFYLLQYTSAFIHRLLLIFGSERGMFPGAIIQFSFVEFEQATETFSKSNIIGLGASSNVYRGQPNDGRVVAIKN